MDWDLIDGLTMVPGIIGTHYLAWQSDDFVYRVAVLSWSWCCWCSMQYHLSFCNPKLLRYDLRAQWVSCACMLLVTPQYSWPVIVGGLIPLENNGRMFVNSISAYYFAWSSTTAMAFLTLAYISYFAQFPLRVKWLHSVFHALAHCAVFTMIQSPVQKYTLDIHPAWAWPVCWFGALFLLP